MMQTNVSSTTRTADSAAVLTKAAVLAVAYAGNGAFNVASGSRPGKVYTVEADAADVSGATWGCSCEWAAHNGALCSHVRAAVRYVEAARRRARRAVAAQAGA